jgi:ABC-2 type transport system ATP-binding protein
MIEVHDLSKRYGDKLAVDHLTFSVQPGRVTGFLGPNGAGKSTTMRLMLGLDWPHSGTVRINGKRYRDLAAPMRTVGALLEAKAVHSGRSAFNHLLFLAQTQGVPRRRVHELLEMVGLSDVAGKRAGGFSLGMSQRLGIAAALLGDPQVLLLDEPVNGLDPEGILWVRNLMKHLAGQGRTVFVSSHLMSEMALTADHLIVIGRGKLIADSSTAEFIDRSSRRAVLVRTPDQATLAAAVTAEGGEVRQAPDGAITVTGMDAPRIGELAAAQRVVLHELSPQLASLEEAFMELTAGSLEYGGGVPGGAYQPGPGGPAVPGGGGPVPVAGGPAAPGPAAPGPGGPGGPGGAGVPR